jgi:hypothetical protein
VIRVRWDTINKKILKQILLTLTMILSLEATAQDLTNQWIDSISGYRDFKEVNIEDFNHWNFENLLSNLERYEEDPISTYIGFFGPNFRRIDFQLKASKNDLTYCIEGRSKLGDNIRPINGQMKLIKAFLRPQEYITDSLFIGIFQADLEEPGDKSGDGRFSGVFTIVFYKGLDTVERFSTSSGDEPNFSNTFVGHWNQCDSDFSKKVIFSFWPSGLYTHLPFCEDVYDFTDNPDYSIIKQEYLKYGWEEWDNFSNRQRKKKW